MLSNCTERPYLANAIGLVAGVGTYLCLTRLHRLRLRTRVIVSAGLPVATLIASVRGTIGCTGSAPQFGSRLSQEYPGLQDKILEQIDAVVNPTEVFSNWRVEQLENDPDGFAVRITAATEFKVEHPGETLPPVCMEFTDAELRGPLCDQVIHKAFGCVNEEEGFQAWHTRYYGCTTYRQLQDFIERESFQARYAELMQPTLAQGLQWSRDPDSLQKRMFANCLYLPLMLLSTENPEEIKLYRLATEIYNTIAYDQGQAVWGQKTSWSLAPLQKSELAERASLEQILNAEFCFLTREVYPYEYKTFTVRELLQLGPEGLFNKLQQEHKGLGTNGS